MVLPKRIGKCIYCGSTEPALTTEHVIPEALGGTELLLEATCEECQRKTAAAENAIGESLFHSCAEKAFSERIKADA